MNSMTTAAEILDHLKALGDPANLEGMARYGIATGRAFGVKMGDAQDLVKRHRGDHDLALELWATGWREARLLAAQIADHRRVTPQLMDAWVAEFDSWDVCDTTCIKLFKRTPHACDKALEWSRSEDLFTRRAGFALMAGLALKSSKLTDEDYAPLLQRILETATDDRSLIKKAVNWALRQIGKRNLALNAWAIAIAQEVLALDTSTARWIANDALRELHSEKMQKKLNQG